MAYKKKNKLHIVAVVAVVRNKDGRYLVLKRSEREIAYPGMYTFPGGKVEDNQTVEETLAEELREEAGLIMKPGKLLLKDKSFPRQDNQTVKVFSYLCDVEDSSKVKISQDFTDYKWISLKELRRLTHVGIEEELRKAEEILRLRIPIEKIATKSVRAD